MIRDGVEPAKAGFASDKLRPNKMLSHPNVRSWPEHRIVLLIDFVNRGWPYSSIARAMGHGVTKSAIASQVRTLRVHGDTRIVEVKLEPIDRLAEAMANGAPSLDVASRIAGLSLYRAEQLWRRICTQLGAQAV